MIDELISVVVTAKLAELNAAPAGQAGGRILTGDDLRRAGLHLSGEQLQAGLDANFRDVARRLGVQFFQALPAVALEQFVLRAILRNEDCAGLLKSLINSFMITYQTQETSDAAFAHLDGLETLRKRVATSRGRISNPMTPHPPSSMH